MLQAAGGDCIREAGHAGLHHGAVFDFHVTSALPCVLQHEIDPGMIADAHFGSYGGIAPQFLHLAGLNGMLHEAVGHQGIDAHQGVRHPDELPGILQFPLGIVMHRKVDGAARRAAVRHAAGVGAVGRDRVAVFQRHIRQEALVAFNQRSFNQRRPGEPRARWAGVPVSRRPPSAFVGARRPVSGNGPRSGPPGPGFLPVRAPQSC